MEVGVEITHLAVGMGLSVVAEIYGESENHLIIMDCGSVSRKEFYGNAIETLCEIIERNGSKIDRVYISHIDSDHINKFKFLSGEFYKKYGNMITSDKLIVGGMGPYNQMGKVKVNRVAKFIHSHEIVYLTEGYGCGNPYGITAKSTDEHFETVRYGINGELEFRLNILLSRADKFPMCAKLDEGVLKNTGSTILIMSIVNINDRQPIMSYLFTGDMTRYTMNIFLKYDKPLYIGEEKKLLTIPHHGTDVHYRDTSFEEVGKFLERYKPDYAVVSSKCKTAEGWNHPHKDTINKYIEGMESGVHTHRVTAFYEDRRKQKFTEQIETEKGVYGTFEITDLNSGDLYKDSQSYNIYNFIFSYDGLTGEIKFN